MNYELYIDSLTVKETAKNDMLKILGIIFMVSDHVGLMLFPKYSIFRILGRLAFPTFAYTTATGYVYTKNFKKYMYRLLIFAAISQIPYSMIEPKRLNVLFTLVLGLWTIHFIEKRNLLFFIPIAIALFLNVDYGIYGISTIVTFYVFRDYKNYNVLIQALITVLYTINYSIPLQLFSLISLVIIYYNFKFRVVINKYFFYAFYPLHILLLSIIKYFVFR